MNPQQFETELAALIERYGYKLTDNEIITALERALDDSLVIAGEPEAWKLRDSLKAALSGLLTFFSPPGEDSMERFERIAAEFYAETGMLAPGKSEPMHMAYQGRDEERRARYDKWVADRVAAARIVCPAPAVREPVKATLA